jgi:acetyl esterase/lipase/lysophospholipase L1-like esterase
MNHYIAESMLKLSRIILVFALLIAVKSTGAQQVIPLYQGIAPGSLPVEDRESFSRPANGRPSVINVTNPTLTLYTPEKQNAARTAVIICPGGGYNRLTIEDGGYEVAKAFAASGITAFVLKYRTWRDSAYVDYRNIPLTDLEQAMTIVYTNAQKWNLDTTHIGIVGFSAGGHLTAMAATATTRRKPAFTILAYPVISFTDSLVSKTLKSRSTLLGTRISESDKIAYSPELHITPATPPAFIVHAEDDSTSLVGNSIAYYKALLAHKVPAQLQVYQKGGHGFALYNKAQDEYWMPAALRWLSLNGFYQPVVAVVAPTAEKAPSFWKDILAFKKQDSALPLPQHPILFVGSSSFTRWKEVNEAFPGYPILNRGFGGSTLPDVIRYTYDVIIPYHPKQVVIYCGENDLASADSITAGEVVNRFKTLFAMIRQNLPNAVISFVSIKPSPVRYTIQPKVLEANKQIKAFLLTQKKAQYIDIYKDMLDAKGNMREELYVEDRLHMKPEGYAIWKKKIGPYLLK